MIKIDGRKYSFEKLKNGDTDYLPTLYAKVGELGDDVKVTGEDDPGYLVGTIVEIISGYLYIEPERTAELLGYENATKMFKVFIDNDPNLKIKTKLYMHKLEGLVYVVDKEEG